MRATAQVAAGAGLITLLLLVARDGAMFDVSPPAPPPHSAPNSMTLATSEYVEFELWSETRMRERARTRALQAMGRGANSYSAELNGTDQLTEDHRAQGHRAIGLSLESIDNLDAILLSVLPGVEPGQAQLSIAGLHRVARGSVTQVHRPRLHTDLHTGSRPALPALPALPRTLHRLCLSLT